jgi:magnesium transporter
MKIFTMSAKGKILTFSELSQVKKSAINWINLNESDLDMFQEISDITDIPLEDMKEFLVDDDEERARLEQQRFVKIIFRAPTMQNGEMHTKPVCIFTKDKFVVTIQKSNTKSIALIEQKLSKGLLKFMFKAPTTGKFIYQLLDMINDEFFQTIERIPIVVRKIQSNEYTISNDAVKQLYSANITLSHFNHAIQANLDVLFSLRKAYTRQFSPKDKEQFNDLYYDALHLLDTERINRDIITNIFNFQSIINSNRTNELFRKIAAYGLIIAIPTLISSIYGMNVDLPLMAITDAFWILLGGMVGISLTFFLIFKAIYFI